MKKARGEERRSFTERLARASGRRPWLTIAAWTVALVLAMAASGAYLGDALVVEAKPTDAPESERGFELLSERVPDYDTVRETIVIESELDVADPAYREFVTGIVEDVTALGSDVVEGAFSYYMTGDPAMVSEDGNATLVPVVMAAELEQAVDDVAGIHDVVEEASADPRFDVLVVGGATLQSDFQEVSENDLRKGEGVGIAVALVILVLVFATAVAAAVPVLLALAAIVAAIGATALLGTQFEFSFFIVNMITMMGLAVGIDYSLFVVSRYREERRAGASVIDAIGTTGATASRAVFFSGVTVILALLGLLIVPSTIFMSLGIGAILVVVFAIMATLTLLPAVLGLLKDRVDSLRVPFLGRSLDRVPSDEEHGFWFRVARGVMAHPVVSLVLSVGLLLALASPYLGIVTGSSMGADSLPDGLDSKRALQVLEEDFGAGSTDPATIVVDGDVTSAEVQEAIAALTASLEDDDLFGHASVMPVPDEDVAVIDVPILSEGDSHVALDAVPALREEHVAEAFDGVEAEALVTGEVAMSYDFTETTNEAMPTVFALVLGLSFVLLTLVFRSIVVPIKAMLMNLLSVGAAYGLMVLVFQQGVGAELLGFQQVDVIEAWIPLFLFSVLFGLSMDYHVFLLSRIREHYLETGDNTDSVAFGLRSTGRIITGAAVIMVAVFGGFAMGDMIMFQQMGFGLAVAVLLDATIIRSVLVPASMRLLGSANWWFPRALDWLPRIDVEGPSSTGDPQRPLEPQPQPV